MTPADADVVAAFSQVARPIIRQCLGPRNCIAAARIAVECLAAFDVTARAVPVQFVVQIRALNVAYVVGLTKENEQRAREAAGSWTELPYIEDRGRRCAVAGWNGHVIVVAADCLIDPSFDDALDAIARAGHRVQTDPEMMIIPLSGCPFEPGAGANCIAMPDDDETRIEVDYQANSDESFRLTPAWETDHIEPAIRLIVRMMTAAITAPPPSAAA